MLAACSGGSGSGDAGIGAGLNPCSGFCAGPGSFLSVGDVEKIIAQAVGEAHARNVHATVAVTDRVGNVLAVYRMNGSPPTVRVGSPGSVDGGLEGVSLVPSEAAAIAKALTGAYLSSEGNAFSTRTASQIIQANFNVGEINQPGGPLFGVQFSQLPCSDLSARFDGALPGPGPARSPLGLSADSGGLPLYKSGALVGAVGVEVDGIYTIDLSVADRDRDIDEIVAIAATYGYAAPRDRRADRITVDGKTLRFSDVDFADLAASPLNAAPLASTTDGSLISVRGYTEAAPAIAAGAAFGQASSGIRGATNADFAARDAFVLVDRLDTNRYPPVADIDGTLTAAEVRQLLLSALDVANRARAQIRQPLGSGARVTVSVTGVSGRILGIARSRDAPVFGIDVSLQKARAALLFSTAGADALLSNLPPAGYLKPDQPAPAELRQVQLGSYVTALRQFSALPNLLHDGTVAFAVRSIGNLARPFFPDGVSGTANGPLSKPAGEWSPFSDGLQLDLSYNAIVRHIAFIAGATASDVPQNCTGIKPLSAGLGVQNPTPLAANGLQIFPGGVPVYRGSQLAGAIGVSGDGIDQDDMVAFLGLHDAGLALGGALGDAPAAARSDQIEIQGTHLRYVQCPQSPFLGSAEQDVCAGK